MAVENLLRAERIATKLTRIQLYRQVRLAMEQHDRVFAESTIADVTFVRLLARVDEFVAGQVTYSGAAETAHVTFVWFRVVMRGHMSCQAGTIDISQSTNFTEKFLELRAEMTASVRAQTDSCEESFPTDVTSLRLLPSVCDFMNP